MDSNNYPKDSKKKYSGALFLENDEFDCFADDSNPTEAKMFEGVKQNRKASLMQLRKISNIIQPKRKLSSLSSKRKQSMNSEEFHPTETKNLRHNQQGVPIVEYRHEENMSASSGNYQSPSDPNPQTYDYQNYYQQSVSPNNMFPMMGIPLMPVVGFPMYNYTFPADTRGDGHDQEYYEFMNLPIEEVMSNFEDRIQDQAGCKLIQARLEKSGGDNNFYTAVLDMMIKNFSVYCKNQFANYLCQKIVELSNEQEIQRIIETCVSDLVDTSCSVHGTRVIQKIIERTNESEMMDLLLDQLHGQVTTLVLDPNGNHVIQKCLSNYGNIRNQFIYDEICEKGKEVGCHKHGCCVIQRCIDYSNLQQKKQIVDIVVKYTTQLVQDQYGNYVVQYVIQLENFREEKVEIAKAISGDILNLCTQKFSSNVIEKCLVAQLDPIFVAMSGHLKNEAVLRKLICHQFGNYVVQTLLLRNKNHPDVTYIISKLKSMADSLIGDENAKKAIHKLSKVFEIRGATLIKKKQYEKNNRRGDRKGNYERKKQAGQQNQEYMAQNLQNMLMYPVNMDQNQHQGYVNMNMNLNFNVNLNYQNQNQGVNPQGRNMANFGHGFVPINQGQQGYGGYGGNNRGGFQGWN